MDASRFRAALLLALTFAAGAAFGVAGDRLDIIPGTVQASETTPPTEREDRRPEDRRARQTTIEAFADQLELTGEQREKIDGILDRYREAVRHLRESVRPQWREILESTRNEIEAELFEEQLEAYRALLEERYGADRDRDRGGEREQGDDDRGRHGPETGSEHDGDEDEEHN
ncbi:MAG: hypothetical protein MJB57_16655 [Gemmatimonadetes bacterium]|nr:hypothetical protein [Gemmatimonadota bacterium]